MVWLPAHPPRIGTDGGACRVAPLAVPIAETAQLLDARYCRHAELSRHQDYERQAMARDAGPIAPAGCLGHDDRGLESRARTFFHGPGAPLPRTVCEFFTAQDEV